MRNNKLIQLLVLGVALGFGGCTESDRIEPKVKPEPVVNTNDSKLSEIQIINLQLEKVAQAMARLITDAEIRVYIKEQALGQAHDEYNLLYQHAAQHTFSDGLTLEQKFIAAGLKDIANIAAELPALQISVPVLCEEWDAANYIPLVAVAPVDFEESGAEVIKSFDDKGKIHLLSIEEDPEVPVIVIGLSERSGEEESGG